MRKFYQTIVEAGSVPMFQWIASCHQFTSWLAQQRVSLASTTDQSGKLLLIGFQPDECRSMFERTFKRHPPYVVMSWVEGIRQPLFHADFTQLSWLSMCVFRTP